VNQNNNIVSLVNTHGVGVALSTENEKELAQICLSMIKENELLKQTTRARRLFTESYDARKISRQILEHFR
jgi:hypothetical protein